jgi:gallate dioxygenase
MAKIVGAFGFPHTPMFPLMVQQQGEGSEVGRYFARVAKALNSCAADVALMFDTDHLNTFFYDNLPIFALGVDEGFSGPNEDVPGLPAYSVPSMAGFAGHLRRVAIENEFDVSLVQEYKVDHSVLVPLHFLTPKMTLPVIPVFINGHVPPLPAARRCHRLGRTIADAVLSWPQDLRVVVMGSGSFSLEVCGPRMAPGILGGVPDRAWASDVCGYLERGDADELIERATPQQLAQAGNVAGELLNWIAMLGAIGTVRPTAILPQLDYGHAFGIWEDL